MRLGLGNNLVKTAFPIGTSPSLDLAFALDRSFTTDPADAGKALITSRRGPAAKFSRGSGATQVNAAGLIEYAPENLLVRSNEFSAATWSRATLGLPIEVVGAGLNGESAWQLQPSGSNSDIGQSITIPAGGSTYTFSVWLRSGTGGNVIIQLNIYDNIAATLRGSKTITVTSHWQRFEVSSSAIVSGNSTRFIIGAFDSWSSGENVLAYGAQVERASTARTYYPTTTAAFYGPRFDHDPTTGDCKGLLIEEPRTNLITNSGNASLWTSANGVVDNLGFVSSPDGTTSGYNAGIGSANLNTSSANGVAGSYTSSVFLKRGNTDWIRLQFVYGVNASNANGWFNLATGQAGVAAVGIAGITNASSTITPYGNGWYKCTLTVTTPGNLSTYFSLISATADNNITRASGSTYNIWGGQIEAGAFASSYIPTTSGTGIRSADVCSITGADFDRVYNQSELSIYSEVSFAPALFGFPAVSFNNQTAAERVELAVFAGPTRLACFVVQNNTTQAAPNISASANQFHKAALYAKLNSFRFALNGVLATKDTVGLMPTATRLNIGKQFNEVYLNGHLKQLTIYRKALTDAKLQTLTTP